uniref:Uncharacterized protein AlNc14C2G261 n=1 Tax=Albugo laibachii Nc14 TaxID=890382 RepID=F0VZC3_9STRA|nr:conserved hypothetical protein [Albugo laibachii Nc14]|eukprot:CCA14153.1 conserved hypothetical protein [Albugo laibachii Nc14]
MENNSIPLLRAAPDALRHGFTKAATSVRPVHPVQQLQAHNHEMNWELKMATVEQVYGKAASMRLRTEKAVLEQFKRLPGLPSSNAGIDTITGMDEQVDLEDILNDANDHSYEHFKVHEAIEVKLALF